MAEVNRTVHVGGEFGTFRGEIGGLSSVTTANGSGLQC